MSEIQMRGENAKGSSEISWRIDQAIYTTFG